MKKIIAWFKQTGLTNIVYGIGGVVALFAGWNLIAGACFGIFGYINFNVIKKIVSDIKFKKEKKNG